MGSALYLLCLKYNGPLSPTAPTATGYGTYIPFYVWQIISFIAMDSVAKNFASMTLALHIVLFLLLACDLKIGSCCFKCIVILLIYFLNCR